MLVEAWLTLRWGSQESFGGPQTDLGYLFALGKFDTGVLDKYPLRVPLEANQIPTEIAHGIPRYQYVREKDGQRQKLLQIGPGVATNNYLSDYDWVEFVKDSLFLRDTLINAYEDKIEFRFISLQVRSANTFDYTKQNMLGVLKSEYGVDVSLSNKFSGDIMMKSFPNNGNIKLSFDLKEPLDKASFNIASGLKKDSDASLVPVLVNEIEVVSENEKMPNIRDNNQMTEWLDSSLELIKSWGMIEK